MQVNLHYAYDADISLNYLTLLGNNSKLLYRTIESEMTQ